MMPLFQEILWRGRWTLMQEKRRWLVGVGMHNCKDHRSLFWEWSILFVFFVSRLISCSIWDWSCYIYIYSHPGFIYISSLHPERIVYALQQNHLYYEREKRDGRGTFLLPLCDSWTRNIYRCQFEERKRIWGKEFSFGTISWSELANTWFVTSWQCVLLSSQIP